MVDIDNDVLRGLTLHLLAISYSLCLLILISLTEVIHEHPNRTDTNSKDIRSINLWLR